MPPRGINPMHFTCTESDRDAPGCGTGMEDLQENEVRLCLITI